MATSELNNRTRTQPVALSFGQDGSLSSAEHVYVAIRGLRVTGKATLTVSRLSHRSRPQVTVRVRDGKKLVHEGIKVEFVSQRIPR